MESTRLRNMRRRKEIKESRKERRVNQYITEGEGEKYDLDTVLEGLAGVKSSTKTDTGVVKKNKDKKKKKQQLIRCNNQTKKLDSHHVVPLELLDGAIMGIGPSVSGSNGEDTIGCVSEHAVPLEMILGGVGLEVVSLDVIDGAILSIGPIAKEEEENFSFNFYEVINYLENAWLDSIRDF